MGLDLLEELAGEPVKPDAYDALPESVKATIDRKSWMWLSDREKNDLVRNECEPEFFND